MKMPLVTISSAFYNPGPFFLDMVKSVFSQTFQDWELILINDGSTDHTLTIAESIKDPRIRIYSNDGNRGRAYSLNRITELARGRYIARMDADDLCSPCRIQKQVDLIEKESELDVVGTGICYLDKKENPIGYTIPRKTHNEICREPTRTFGLCHGSALGKKEWFQKNPYDEKLIYAVDFSLWLRSYQKSCFGNVSDPLYYYRFDNSFHLKKQFCARKMSARFLYDHLKNSGEYGKAIFNFIVQYGKFAATTVLFYVGLRDKLMAKRFKTLSEDQLEFHKKEILRIKSISLPSI